jgi:hypothetical protein
MKPILKIILYLLIVSIAFGNIYSQGNSEIEKVLKTAFLDNAVKFTLEKTKQLGSLDYKVPFLEKVEVRSETNDFDIQKQDLSIRVSPNTKSSRKAYRLYHESVMFMADMEHNTELMKVLYEKYLLLKEYVSAKEMLRIENNKNDLALDKVKLLKRMISLSSFDIVELIEAEDELYKLQRKIQNIESKVNNLHLQLSHILSSDEVNINFEDLISVHKIKDLLSLEMLTIDENHPEEEVLSAKHYNTMMEYEWEASKSKFSIGFVQAKYGHNPDKSFGNNFSLGFGFDFPIKGSTSLNLNEIKVNILDAQSKYLDLKEQIKSNQQISKLKLNSLINMYELLSTQIEEGNANHALNEYSKQGIASPKAILKLKELTVNNEALLLEIRTEIIHNYLNYIYNTGIIGDTPYKNFFDENLTQLQ